MRHPAWCVWMLLACAPAFAALEGVNHAEICGRCHRDILSAWKQSAHARAMENPIFQDALERAEEVSQGARPICLGCHAPTVKYSGDLALKMKASWEGVTCDFCHSVKSVEVTGHTAALDVRFDGTKTGPLKDAASIAHGTAFSSIHTTSLLCAGCHEYRNAQGFGVLTTYSEWEQSSYGSSGKNCQDCHMAETSADVVDPKIKRMSRSVVNLHAMPGSRSLDMLNKAVSLRMRTRREGDELVAEVDLENRGAGHRIPTGSPLRRIELEVELAVGGRQLHQKRTFQRRVADAQGKEITREELVFLRASRELADNRLKPGEKHTEVFRFPLARSESGRVYARLWYHYSPQERSAAGQSVKFLVFPQYVPVR
jgi:Cytochrome c554 and c-prime